LWSEIIDSLSSPNWQKKSLICNLIEFDTNYVYTQGLLTCFDLKSEECLRFKIIALFEENKSFLLLRTLHQIFFCLSFFKKTNPHISFFFHSSFWNFFFSFLVF
jgi:hypothetical protein